MSHIAPSMPNVARAKTLQLLLVLALFAVPLTGCSEGLIVGEILRGLTNDVNSVIENAGAEARAVELAAAGAVNDAINNAASAFATVLDKGINQVNDAIRSSIQQLRQLVADLKTGALELLQAATAGAQQLINSLPFTNKNPQVTSYSPRLLAPSGGPVEVFVRGNFVWAFQNKLTPSLKVGGTTYEPNLLTTQELGFAVPADHFMSNKDRLVPVSLELVTPYEQGRVFKSIVPGTFRLLVAVLPASPVKSLTLTTTIAVSGTATKTTVVPEGAADGGGGWYLNSYDCLEHKMVQAIPADPEWTIVPSSAREIYTWNKHPSAATVEIDRARSQLVVKATTYPRCILGVSNGSGSITFYVQYTQEQERHSSKEETTPLTIGWGDRLVQPVPRGKWQLDAQLFDGRTLQFRSSDTSNQYLSVLDQGDSILISTPDTGGFLART